MANLTLNVDDDLLKQCRLYAVHHDTSVNAMVRAFLASVVGQAQDIARDERLRAMQEVHRLARQLAVEKPIPEAASWTREDAYAERLTQWQG